MQTMTLRTLLLTVSLSMLGGCASQPPETLTATIVESGALIRATGFSPGELKQLRESGWSSDQWQALVRVSVDDADVPVAGRYRVAADAVEFRPAFRLDPGRSYAVQLDPAHLPSPRSTSTVRMVLSLPGEPAGPATVVTAVHPSSGRWPSNLLRFYITFSGPMARTSGASFVRVIDETGEEVRDALLQTSAVDFWNDDATRYTVLFDPGRVKRGILPNRDKGRALVPGQHYVIVIESSWKDAAGRPLGEAYRHEFTAGPPVERAIEMESWTLTTPAAGSQRPLIITFPYALDHALLQRAVGVANPNGEILSGRIDVVRNETEWRFTPGAAWVAGTHEIVALPVLEDPSSNRIGAAFETDAIEASQPYDRSEQVAYRRAFEIR